MSKIWILIRAQLMNFFPINEMKEPGNKKQSSIVITSFGIITLAIFFFNIQWRCAWYLVLSYLLCSLDPFF